MLKMRTLARSVVAAGLLFGGISLMNAAQQDQMKDSAGRTSAAVQRNSVARELLVFVNPNGRPCQMQMAILDSMAGGNESRLQVTYVKTTEAKDRQTFYRYGIRGLPSIIIVDAQGEVVKRLAPGIQSEENILQALGNK